MSETSGKISVSCPACQKMYRVPTASAGKQATCNCGQRFTIEAMQLEVPDEDDYSVAPAAPAKTATPACKNHPDVPATAACSQCRAFVCSTCDYPQNDGSHLCVDCSGVPRIVTSDHNPYMAPAAPQAINAPCRNHAESMAIARCQRCKTPVCDTCDFVFPGGIHICPSCATDTTVRMSSTRKAMIGWSLGMAGILTVLMVLLMSGMLAEFVMNPAGDMVITFAMQISGLIGVGLAFGSLDSRAGNSALVWVSIVWNCLIFGVFLLIMVVGLIAIMNGMA